MEKIMRTILAIGIILGFVALMIIGLLSVLRDLLVRTTLELPAPVDDNEESGHR
jgi:hypothetical protein